MASAGTLLSHSGLSGRTWGGTALSESHGVGGGETEAQRVWVTGSPQVAAANSRWQRSDMRRFAGVTGSPSGGPGDGCHCRREPLHPRAGSRHPRSSGPGFGGVTDAGNMPQTRPPWRPGHEHRRGGSGEPLRQTPGVTAAFRPFVTATFPSLCHGGRHGGPGGLGRGGDTSV